MAEILSVLEQQYIMALEKCPGMMRRFVEEYLIDLDQNRAARAAGYATRPDVAGSRCMSDVRVKNAIHFGEQIKAEKSMLKSTKVLNELALIVHSDIRDYRVNPKTGRIKLRKGALPSAFKAIQSIKIKTRKFKDRKGQEVVQVEQEIRLWNKNTAIEQAMRHLGLLKNDVNIHDSALEKFLRDRAVILQQQARAQAENAAANRVVGALHTES